MCVCRGFKVCSVCSSARCRDAAYEAWLFSQHYNGQGLFCFYASCIFLQSAVLVTMFVSWAFVIDKFVLWTEWCWRKDRFVTLFNLLERHGPLDSADLHFCIPRPDTSLQYKTTRTGPLHHGVLVYSPAYADTHFAYLRGWPDWVNVGGWLKHQDGVNTTWTSERSPIAVLTRPVLEQLRWSRPTCYHYAKPRDYLAICGKIKIEPAFIVSELIIVRRRKLRAWRKVMAACHWSCD